MMMIVIQGLLNNNQYNMWDSDNTGQWTDNEQMERRNYVHSDD